MPALQPHFVHLHVHSEYSVYDSLVRIEDLIDFCERDQARAIALTDQMNLFGLVKFYQAAEKKKIKPIIGADLLIYAPQFPNKHFRMLVLCKNNQGYDLLKKIISKAYLEGYDTLSGKAMDQSWLWDAACSGHLILIAPSFYGEVYQTWKQNKWDQAEAILQTWQAQFPGDYFLEITRISGEQELEFNKMLLNWAQKHQIPCVASNQVRFVETLDFEAHEARVCINQGYTLEDKTRPKHYTDEQYLRSTSEMQDLFSFCPSALENSVQIAYRCNVTLKFGEVFLPNFLTPNQMPITQYLSALSQAGLEKILQKNPKPEQIKASYFKRLEIELKVINDMGFAGYFLIVADFIQWAKAQDIPVGPGRGSGAGSLVAYALGITNLDPLPYDLLFERFLNPERVSMPDFDIDFCMEKRDKVIEYVAHKYGKNAVSQIITFGTMAAKAVVRDVGRVLGQPYGFVDKLAKLIPFELGITLETAIEQEPILKDRYEKEEEVRILLDLALKLEGITRSVGKHAGGVVIAPGDLSDFTPIYAESNDGAIVSQFDKNDVETIGLVKFDFLGLRTLTIIDWALKSIPDKVDIDSLALDDFKTLELLRSGETTAIFQLESRGMKELIIRLKPDNFEDIIALVALYRPGPLQSGMVDDFINRKHGLEPIEDLHPDIAYVLKPTYGIILYQEQVMQIAQVLAGYTLGGADLLRRAMGKKKPEEMAKQRSIFVEGSKARGVDAETAAYIFDLMEKFAGYGFNKSHSAAYALLTYQTAWLKAHYPGAFMAAVLSSDMNHTDKVVGFIEEVKRMKLNMLSPNINASAYYFSFNAKIGAIIYGLGAIKGVGEAAIENILETRKTKGAFKDLFDFCARVDLRKVTKRVLEALIKSGAFDDFIEHRAWALANLETAQHAAQQKASNNQKGQGDLFALLEEPEPIKKKPSQPWPLELQLKYEKEVLGFYLSGHPIQQYEQELAGMHVCPLKQLNLGSSKARVAGFILDIRTKINSKNKKMAFITLDDGSTRMEIPLFGEVYEKLGPQLIKDVLLIFDIEISKDFSGKMRLKIKVIYNIWQARKLFSKFVRIKVEPGQDFKNNQDLAQNLLKIIKQYASPLTENSQQLFVEYSLEAHEKPVRLKLAGCSILLNGQSFQAIQEAPGIAAVDLIY